MTRERADEILRMTFYGKMCAMPQLKDSGEAFYVGIMVGEMLNQLKAELYKEIRDEVEE